jgi:hypothetical protein
LYERCPQKSPQLTIPNFRTPVLTDNPDTLGRVPKSVWVLKWTSGYPGKRSRQLDITLQATVSGLGRLKRKAFSAGREIRARHLVVPIQTDRILVIGDLPRFVFVFTLFFASGLDETEQTMRLVGDAGGEEQLVTASVVLRATPELQSPQAIDGERVPLGIN